MRHLRALALVQLCIVLAGCAESSDDPSDAHPEPSVMSSATGVSQAALVGRKDWTPIDASPYSSITFDAWLPNLAYQLSSGEWFQSWSLGERWRPLPKPNSGALSYTSFLVDPNRPGGALVQGVYEAGAAIDLLATHDAGHSWRRVSRMPDLRLLAVAPGNGDVLWATPWGPTPFLYRSSDRGATWSVLDFGGPGSCCADFVALSERDVLALGNIAQLQRSFDGGETWPINTTVDLYFIGSFDVDRRKPDLVYVGSYMDQEPGRTGIGLRRSTDGGRTWAAPNAELARSFVHSIAVSPADSRVYVVARPSEEGARRLWVSADAGTTFALADEGLGGQEVGGVSVHPRLPCVAFVYTSAGVFRTSNGGGTCR